MSEHKKFSLTRLARQMDFDTANAGDCFAFAFGISMMLVLGAVSFAMILFLAYMVFVITPIIGLIVSIPLLLTVAIYFAIKE